MNTTAGQVSTSWYEVDELITMLRAWGIEYLVGLEPTVHSPTIEKDALPPVLLLQRLAQCDDIRECATYLWEDRQLPPPACHAGTCGLLALEEAEQKRTGLPFTFTGDWQNQIDRLLPGFTRMCAVCCNSCVLPAFHYDHQRQLVDRVNRHMLAARVHVQTGRSAAVQVQRRFNREI